MLTSEDAAQQPTRVEGDDAEMPTIVLSPGDHRPLYQATAASEPPPTTSTSHMRQVFLDKDAAMATSEARAEELLQFHEERLSWRVYRVLCQIRFGYLSFLVLMVLLMFSFTMLMEIFFAIFLPSARTFSTEYIVRSTILLALMPFMLFFLSYFYEEATRFFFDAINKTDGGLPNFRLALTVVIHYVRNRSTYKATDADAARRESLNNSSRDSAAQDPMRASFFITSKDDPFADIDDDQEVEETAEDVREWTAAREQETQQGAVTERSPLRSRWKAAGNAVIAVNLMRRENQFDGPAIGLTTFLVVDFICPVVFELSTTFMFLMDLITSWSPYSAFLTYVRNGFWLMGFYVVVWMACHFWSSRNPHMRRLVSYYRRKRRVLRREVRNVAREKQADHLWLLDVGFRFYHHVGVFINPLAWIRSRKPAKPAAPNKPGQFTSEADTTVLRSADAQPALTIEVSEPEAPSTFSAQVAKRLQNARAARAKIRAKNPWYRLSYNRQAVILMTVCVIAALISLWSFMIGWPLMGIGLIMLSNVIQRRFPQIFGDTFRHFITAFVVMSLIFFSSTFIIGTFVSGGSFQLGIPTNETTSVATIASDRLPTPVSQTIEYPVCSIDYDGLTVLDLALIADAAYGSTPTIQETAVRNRFAGTELQNFTFVAHNNASEHQVWMELYFPTINMTVLAIRGTASATDALEDLHFWFGILIMQCVDIFVPFLKQLPRDFVVGLLSMRSISSFMPAPVYQSLLDHAFQIKERVGDQFVVTGHSLGGAMAAVMGARVETQVVSLSGPGLLYSRGRFDVDAQDVRDYVLTLKPQRDIVPQVDQLGGMVQELRCRHKSPMSCHSSTTHMCELYLSCGDSRERNWTSNAECNAYFKLPELPTTD